MHGLSVVALWPEEIFDFTKQILLVLHDEILKKGVFVEHIGNIFICQIFVDIRSEILSFKICQFIKVIFFFAEVVSIDNFIN